MIEILIYGGNLILLINIILFIIGFSRNGKAYKIFTCYLGIVFSIQIVSWIIQLFHMHNLFLSHFYFIGQFILLGMFYENLLKTSQQKYFGKWVIALVLMALFVQYLVDPNQFVQFNLFEIAITSLIVVVFAVLHLYNMLADKKEFYFINLGIIIYLFGSTILFFVGNLTASLSPKFSLITWTLNAFLYIVYQLFVLIEWKKSFSSKIL